jgi:hypothetical protein
MKAVLVVPSLQELKNVSPGFGVRQVVALLDEFALQRGVALLQRSPVWMALGRVRPGRGPLTLQGQPPCRSKRTPLAAITSRSRSTE